MIREKITKNFKFYWYILTREPNEADNIFLKLYKIGYQDEIKTTTTTTTTTTTKTVAPRITEFMFSLLVPLKPSSQILG